MFTGLVAHVGTVVAVEGRGARRLEVRSDLTLDQIETGASVAHSGVCLTVIEKGPDGAGSMHVVEASSETLARTTIGAWQPGKRINLERSLRLGDELGGHLVFGHVDATVRLLEVVPDGECQRLRVELPRALAPMVAIKGSLALDGVSLSVNAVTEDSFCLLILPYTWQHTTLLDRRPGDSLNLEIDMLARYVERQMHFLKEDGR